MKACRRCKVSKAGSAFSVNKNGLRTMCLECTTKVKALNAKLYEKKKEQILAKNAEWVLKNREQKNAHNRKWCKANPAQNASKRALRRAIEKQATPIWADQTGIAMWYEVAEVLSRSGVKFHVDHIVPLNNPLVCGLHTDQNLQVLPASDNLRKSNRQWPDMP